MKHCQERRLRGPYGGYRSEIREGRTLVLVPQGEDVDVRMSPIRDTDSHIRALDPI
jgi:hypothetical protein